MRATLLRCYLVWLVSGVLLFSGVPANAGTFKNPELIQTTYDPIGIAAGDFNRDGVLDLVYVDGARSYALHVLLGNGDGTFSHGQDIGLPDGICGYGSCSINVADVTHDGRPDIILGGSGTSTAQLVSLVGVGDGTFQSPIVSALVVTNGNYPTLNTQMGIGDVDGDGAADLVVPDSMGEALYVLRGNNTGKFVIRSAQTIYFTGQAVAYLLDLNGDGHLDVVVNDRIGATTHVLLGNGNGTFQTSTDYVSYAMLLADMDGDGHPDLVGEVYPGQIQVLRGNADGTFDNAVTVANVPPNAQIVSAGDLNGDGNVDLVLLAPPGVGILPGKGNLNYGSMIPSVSGTPGAIFSQSGAVVQADFNNDGRIDVAMGVNGGIVVLRGNGDGSFVSADSYDIGQTLGTIAVADFTGDKIPDIAVTVPATYPKLLRGLGNGTFGLLPDQNQSYTSQSPSSYLAPGDFNGDGKGDLEIIETNADYPYGQSLILLGKGNATFATPAGVPLGQGLIGDANGDGRSDLIAIGNGVIEVLLGQANGSFTPVTTALRNPTFGVGAVGDLNHDAKLDLVVYEYPALRVWLGNGDGTFRESSLLGRSSGGEPVAIADVDGDGNGDILLLPALNPTGPQDPLLIYYGNGDGTFQDPLGLPLSHLYSQVIVADVNRDNAPDLVLTDGAGIAVIQNLGGRNFGQEAHYVAGQGISGMTVTDVNGDGFPDIVAGNAGGTTVAVLLNQPNGNPVEGAVSSGLFTITPEPANYGQAITLSILMSSATGPVPSGSASFSVDGTFIGTVALTNGKAVYSYGGSLVTGTHTFVATYNGDRVYQAESFSKLHIVQPPIYATHTVLTAAPLTILASRTVRLTATVSSVVAVPGGFVTFLDGGNNLAARPIDEKGIALLDTALLKPGTHSLTAVYQGVQEPFGEQAVFKPSTSAGVSVMVNATPTATSLASSTNSQTQGLIVTFRASVTADAGTAAGGVTFYDGTIPIGSSSLKADGTCEFSTASLGIGTHNITATFNANGVFAASVSKGSAVVVTGAASNLTASVVALSRATTASSTTLVAQVEVPSGLPSGEVAFLDSGQILGHASINDSGSATLSVPQLERGTHQLSASFSGDPNVAPSASPELFEQWANDEPQFSLTVDPSILAGQLGAVQSTTVTVAQTGVSMLQVHLSCADGLPLGYTCSFTPASLVSGNSLLQLQTTEVASRKRVSWLLALSLGVWGTLLVCGRSHGWRQRCIIMILMTGTMLGFAGCGTSRPSGLAMEMRVLSVRGTAAATDGSVIHSTQIIAKFDRRQN